MQRTAVRAFSREAGSKGTASDPIVKTPGVCGGVARLRGRRVPVWLLAAWRRDGLSEAQILEALPDVGIAELAAAWAYEAGHPEEIERAIRDHEAP